MGYRHVEAGPLVRSSYHARKHTDGALATSATPGEEVIEAGHRPLEPGGRGAADDPEGASRRAMRVGWDDVGSRGEPKPEGSRGCAS